jgi:hypothetical protein
MGRVDSEPTPVYKRLRAVLPVATAVVYFFSNPKPQNYYDYTFRVAENLLRGSIGFVERQPSWLNEFVPYDNAWYSVFPLGAVLSMIPAALLKVLGVITEMPGAWISAILAGVCCWFLLMIADRYDVEPRRKVLATLGILFGTFMWTNLTFAGAWQLALGYAMVGQVGAIYFSVFSKRPLLAGAFFALAFGNRTEILLTAPVFFYLLARKEKSEAHPRKGKDEDVPGIRNSQPAIRTLAEFCVVPFALGVSTLVYNYVRFDSFTDFGYARIPGVLEEPWYQHGIFSVQYIPGQIWEMLFKMWTWRSTLPYLVPDGFSASILFSSPFLILMLRVGARDGALKLAAWIAIAIMTVILWMHGNSGGWQFGYRYFMVALPWVFVLLLENAPKRVSPVEWALYGISFVANTYATWLFNFTDYLKQQ